MGDDDCQLVVPDQIMSWLSVKWRSDASVRARDSSSGWLSLHEATANGKKIETIVPRSGTKKESTSKCFIWRRLGAKKPVFFSLCTELYRLVRALPA